jgi:hypothetical protein
MYFEEAKKYATTKGHTFMYADGIKGKFYSTKDFQFFFDKMPKNVSNLYEIIDGSSETVPYMDIDFPITNTEFNSTDLLYKFLNHYCDFFNKTYDFAIKPSDFKILTATSVACGKGSFHAILRPKTEIVFQNNQQQKCFVNRLINELPKEFFFNNKAMIDNSVYSKNRKFRIPNAVKRNHQHIPDRVLRTLDASPFDEEYFINYRRHNNTMRLPLLQQEQKKTSLNKLKRKRVATENIDLPPNRIERVTKLMDKIMKIEFAKQDECFIEKKAYEYNGIPFINITIKSINNQNAIICPMKNRRHSNNRIQFKFNCDSKLGYYKCFCSKEKWGMKNYKRKINKM